MSIKIMTNVWQYSKQKGSALLLLLAIADNASDSGYAFPGIDYLARKTRLSPRQVMRLVQKVEETGELTAIRKKIHNEYVVNVWPDDFNGIRRCERCGALDIPEIEAGLHKHHKIPTSQGGSDAPENIEILCRDCHELHHKMTRDKMTRDKMTPLGDTCVTSKVTQVSPEPSLTVNKPSFLQNSRNPVTLQDFSSEKKTALNLLVPYLASISDIQDKDDLRSVTLLGYEVAQVCKLDIALTSIANLKTIARITIALNTKKITQPDLKNFQTWWYNEYWLGKDKNQPPTPGQLGDNWGQFEESRQMTKSSNNNGPTLTPEQKAQLDCFIAQDAQK